MPKAMIWAGCFVLKVPLTITVDSAMHLSFLQFTMASTVKILLEKILTVNLLFLMYVRTFSAPLQTLGHHRFYQQVSQCFSVGLEAKSSFRAFLIVLRTTSSSEANLLMDMVIEIYGY